MDNEYEKKKLLQKNMALDKKERIKMASLER
jgi:hypothetical protein